MRLERTYLDKASAEQLYAVYLQAEVCSLGEHSGPSIGRVLI